MRPTRLPHTLEALDAWQVYTDWLEERGDEAHARLAVDLALPALPSAEHLAPFHGLATDDHGAARSRRVAWQLGFAMTLELVSARWRTSKLGGGLLPEELAATAEALGRPRFALLEALRLRLDPALVERPWRRFRERLPSTCRRLELDTKQITDETQERLAEHLPSQCTALELSSASPALVRSLPRHVLVEIDASLTAEQAELMAATLGPGRLTLHRATRDIAPLLEHGVALGRPGEATLTNLETGAARVLRRPTLRSLQARFGIIGVRAALERSVSERYRVPNADLERALVRHHGGRWTIRPDVDPSVLAIVRRGANLLQHDDELLIGGAPFRFQLNPGVSSPLGPRAGGS